MPISSTLPVLLFAVLFGLSMDYEVFLLTRIKEAYETTHNNKKSIVFGIEKSCRIITSAAVIVIVISGDSGTYRLLILSQVILSLQLPFAVVPLVWFTSSRAKMGRFVNRPWLMVLAWIITVIIAGLNIYLLGATVLDWFSGKGS